VLLNSAQIGMFSIRIADFKKRVVVLVDLSFLPDEDFYL
jgi:hypothetical protein